MSDHSDAIICDVDVFYRSAHGMVCVCMFRSERSIAAGKRMEGEA
jgi:hypothetical protein